MIVTIDGPAGSGKSSTARAVAERLKIQFLDSGALYRVATLLYIDSGKSEPLFFERLEKSTISFHFQEKIFHVFLDGEEVTDKIRTMEVSEHVSEVASRKEVRAFVNALMREAVKKDVYVADGRDLGTAVFPDADLKFFMVADLETRARRRFDELKEKGMEADLDSIKQNIEVRDQKDSSRSEDPLKKADDAILIDTSKLTFEEQLTKIADQVSDLVHNK
ncbi:(d)CMP kinase [Balneola sp. MJW-20]|uniref:(d)CMP kinase n=1 Tax=Gracilimonas aurantiaca TaxID=3234185 RepID=UPI003466BFEE